MKGVISLIVIFTFFHLLASNEIIDPKFYPSPFFVIQHTGKLLWNGDLFLNLLHSLRRLILAAFIAFPSALFLAILSARLRWFDQLLSPVIAFTFPLPKVAIYPLMLLMFGIDESSKIALISIGIFYLIFINTRLSMKRLLESEINDIVKIYPLKKLDYYLQYLLKGSLPEIMTGAKLGLNYGLTLVIVSETTISNNGIGYYIWRSWDQFNILNVYSAVYLLCFIGFVIYSIFDKFIEHNRQKYY